MLRLYLLGSLRLFEDDTPLNLAVPPKTLHLLAYLLLHRRAALTRDQLAFALWPDRTDADARGQLRRYLYRLRQFLPDGPWLITHGEQVHWNTAAAYWLDIEEFERLSCGGPEQLETALKLYTDDLLIDLYEDWVIIEREQLRERYLEGQQRLLEHYRDQRDYNRAIACGLLILQREPFRENIVRELMQLRVAAGDRNRALEDYRQFQQRVVEELGVQPLPETTADYEQLRLVAMPADVPRLQRVPRDIRPRLVNVPAPLTRLFGREAELAAVCELLQSVPCNARLVTLTGAGGTGKTRLAQAVAQRLAQHSAVFSDGLYYVSLSSLTSPDFVLPAIAKVLDVLENGERSLNDAVKAALRHKDLLLILDNFEHLLEAAPLVTDLMTVSADLRVLVTSREVLHVYGEYEYEVPPLPLPDLDHLPPIDELQNHAALALFVERARAVKAGFALTAANIKAVAEICVRLDGLPLAIELAAAHSKLLTPLAMLERLTDRLGFLVGQARDVPDRQRTLRGVIDWSYNLLRADEKRLFVRLGVFAGSFTVEAVEAVGITPTVRREGNLPGVIDQLSALIDKHILHAIPDELEHEPRFRLLATLREYAQERLRASGDFAMLQNRHLQYRLTLAQQGLADIGGPRQAEWLQRLDADRDNFRAALSWALEHSDHSESGLQLTVALGKFWLMHGDWSEGEQWLKRALAQASDALPVWRARALNIASELADKLGNVPAANALAEESLSLFRVLGDERGLADALCNLAGVSLTHNDYARAELLLIEALALYRRLDVASGTAMALSSLGMAAKERGDYAHAETYFNESLDLNRRAGDSLGIAQDLAQLSYSAYWQSDYARSAELGRQSLEAARCANSRRGMAIALDGLGAALACLGRFDEACACLTDSLILFRELGNKSGEATVLADLAHVAIEQGDYARAEPLYLEGLTLACHVGDRRRMSFCLEGLGQVLTDADLERAAICFGAAQQVRHMIASPLPPSEKQLCAQAIKRIRAGLSDGAFEAAWHWGQTTPVDEIATRLLGRS